MSTKKYDYLVFIGRFAPFHRGHKAILNKALTLAEHVIVLIGSSNRPRTIQNPWTYSERASMIFNEYPSSEQARIHTVALNDYMYNEDAWIKEVQSHVNTAIQICEARPVNNSRPRRPSEVKVGKIGFQKDKTSGYLNLFPQWETELYSEVKTVDDRTIHGTDIRQTLFEYGPVATQLALVTPTIQRDLDKFAETDEYLELVKEYQCIQKGHEAWATAPYKPYFITVDALVVQSGHLLMVVRGSSPGKNLWALPGGFLEQDEFLMCGALRELEEETKIDCPAKVLRGSLKGSGVFDHPRRSARGRTVTHAFHFELPPGPLPKVKGSDDAKHAMWVPFNEIDSSKIFEDHFDIITHFINIT